MDTQYKSTDKYTPVNDKKHEEGSNRSLSRLPSLVCTLLYIYYIYKQAKIIEINLIWRLSIMWVYCTKWTRLFQRISFYTGVVVYGDRDEGDIKHEERQVYYDDDHHHREEGKRQKQSTLVVVPL